MSIRSNEPHPRGTRLHLGMLGAIVACFAMTALALEVGGPASPPGSASSPSQREFASPEEAVEALLAATRADQGESLLSILGPHGAKLIHSGDSIADRDGRQRFIAAYDQAHHLEHEGSNEAVLLVGAEDWPLPIPLVHDSGGWRFDTRAGEQQIIDRRVGRNELNVIEVCRAYVQAQREYADLQASGGGGERQYAQRFLSHAGQRDGLYWPITGEEAESPLGPLVAQARAEGYMSEPPSGKRHPYFGYYYRILTRQGAHASGGARNYIAADGRMSGGFALLAYPAVYGDSGVMTFIVNQNGIVREKNLGPHTAKLAPAIKEYDPDSSWRIALDH